MKKLLFFLVTAVIITACDKNNQQQTPFNNQKNDFSLNGKTYVYETKCVNNCVYGTTIDWYCVLKFISKDSVIVYETPNKDLSYGETYDYIVDTCHYTLDKKDIKIECTYKYTFNLVDTATIYSETWGYTYKLK